MTAAYTISDYRYAANSVSVRPTPDGSGWQTRAARLAGAMKARWCHRAGGYLMSPAKAARFERMYAEGYDGNSFTGELIPPC